jgi:hypothetical protein
MKDEFSRDAVLLPADSVPCCLSSPFTSAEVRNLGDVHRLWQGRWLMDQRNQEATLTLGFVDSYTSTRGAVFTS